jgi:hypothetical protein
VSEIEEDIKATAEALIDDAERLVRIEEKKLQLEPGDPRRVDLSESARELIAGMAPKGEAQRELVNESEVA